MYILISIISIIGIVFMFVWMLIHDKWQRFQKNLKNGDVVDYYDRDGRSPYKLINKGEIYCIISRNGKEKRVLTNELYPNFWYDYET